VSTSEPKTTIPIDVIEGADILGESPIWLEDRQRLVWVDIRSGLLCELDPPTGEKTTEQFPTPLGFVLPRRGGGLVVGVGMSIVLVDPDGSRRTLVQIDDPNPGNRFNDARCDAQGRLWAGGVSVPPVVGAPRLEGVCSLYRIEADGTAEVMLDNLTVSNGLGWLDEGRTFLHTDTQTQTISRYRVDVERGTLHDGEPWVVIDRADGIPDGMTIDSEDGIWVALFGGGELRRYAPDGSILGRYAMPVTGVTCPTFGGPDYQDLYATSATLFLSPEEIERQQIAGSLFRMRPGVTGRPELPFAG
jgi:sugar lactone lactonase YvrE